MSLPQNRFSTPKWFIRNQATQQRFTSDLFDSRAQAETEIGKILTETKGKGTPSPCLESVQLLVE